MLYFVLVALALGFVKAEKSAILELTGDAPTVHFGELGGSDVLTLTHSPTDRLYCNMRSRGEERACAPGNRALTRAPGSTASRSSDLAS